MYFDGEDSDESVDSAFYVQSVGFGERRVEEVLVERPIQDLFEDVEDFKAPFRFAVQAQFNQQVDNGLADNHVRVLGDVRKVWNYNAVD